MDPLGWIGNRIALYLQKPSSEGPHLATCRPEALMATIRKGDVLLVDGTNRISTAIKYLTQSTWSHAALCIQDQQNAATQNEDEILLLEADVVDGVRIVPLSNYLSQHTRICRPVGLSEVLINKAVDFAKAKLGNQYDTKNVIDLIRYVIQTPPVPVAWRRSMLKLGSGDPTRAICSSLIAQAFQSIHYPILPSWVEQELYDNKLEKIRQRLFFKRHHTLFVPRDFDISPYFNVIKPSLVNGFDFQSIEWQKNENVPM